MIIINDNLNNLPKQITITFGRVQWVAPKKMMKCKDTM